MECKLKFNPDDAKIYTDSFGKSLTVGDVIKVSWRVYGKEWVLYNRIKLGSDGKLLLHHIIGSSELDYTDWYDGCELTKVLEDKTVTLCGNSNVSDEEIIRKFNESSDDNYITVKVSKNILKALQVLWGYADEPTSDDVEHALLNYIEDNMEAIQEKADKLNEMIVKIAKESTIE